MRYLFFSLSSARVGLGACYDWAAYMLEEGEESHPSVDEEVRPDVDPEDVPERSLLAPEVEEVHYSSEADVREVNFYHFILLE